MAARFGVTPVDAGQVGRVGEGAIALGRALAGIDEDVLGTGAGRGGGMAVDDATAPVGRAGRMEVHIQIYRSRDSDISK